MSSSKGTVLSKSLIEKMKNHRAFGTAASLGAYGLAAMSVYLACAEPQEWLNKHTALSSLLLNLGSNVLSDLLNKWRNAKSKTEEERILSESESILRNQLRDESEIIKPFKESFAQEIKQYQYIDARGSTNSFSQTNIGKSRVSVMVNGGQPTIILRERSAKDKNSTSKKLLAAARNALEDGEFVNAKKILQEVDRKFEDDLEFNLLKTYSLFGAKSVSRLEYDNAIQITQSLERFAAKKNINGAVIALLIILEIDYFWQKNISRNTNRDFVERLGMLGISVSDRRILRLLPLSPAAQDKLSFIL
jgi:hypothetical protein